MNTDSIVPAPFSNSRPGLSDEVARRYAPRIRRHVGRVARRLPQHVQAADLVSAGYAGLVDAYRRFDTARMESFEAYVDQRIRGAILDELRSTDPLTRDQRVFARKLAATTHRLASELGRPPVAEETAAALGLTLDAMHAQLSRMNATSARTAATGFDEEAADAAGDCWDRPDEIAERSQDVARMSVAVEALPPRNRQVLRMLYDEGRTLKQIGESLGVTESRVSQIHSETIVRLRGMMNAN